jgi:hypothetical protein
MSEVKSRFEVRDGIKNADRHNAMIQTSYDTVNRMAALLDGITFGELLTQPFKELIPRILANVPQAAEHGLLDDPEEVVALFNRLMAGHPDDNFQAVAEAMCDEDAVLSRELFKPSWKLWFYHGIRLPEFSRYPERNEGTRDAINELVAEAPEFNYRTIHETPRTKDLRSANLAIRRAVDNFIIYLPPHNSLCCTCLGGCHCTLGLSSDYCTISNGTCSLGSTGCGESIVRV